MATRKKKSSIIESAEVAEMYKASQPQVVKGSHLTVTTYPDGRTELEWDDEALERDVREAIASVEKTEKPKRKRKEKV